MTNLHDEALQMAILELFKPDSDETIPFQWEEITIDGQREYRKKTDCIVKAYLDHLSQNGWKLTPRQATKKMFAEGASVWERMHDLAPSPGDET